MFLLVVSGLSAVMGCLLCLFMLLMERDSLASYPGVSRSDGVTRYLAGVCFVFSASLLVLSFFNWLR